MFSMVYVGAQRFFIAPQIAPHLPLLRPFLSTLRPLVKKSRFFAIIFTLSKLSSVLGQVAAMTIEDAIFNLETYGRHHLEKIQIDHDKSCEKLLRESVAVLEGAGMIEWDKVPKWAHCDVRIINRPIEKTEFMGDL